MFKTKNASLLFSALLLLNTCYAFSADTKENKEKKEKFITETNNVLDVFAPVLKETKKNDLAGLFNPALGDYKSNLYLEIAYLYKRSQEYINLFNETIPYKKLRITDLNLTVENK